VAAPRFAPCGYRPLAPQEALRYSPGMNNALPDFSAVFAPYEALAAAADALFERVRAAHPECVFCRPGCSDCCHALFDLTLVEAVYAKQRFAEAFPEGPERSAILEAAGVADRKTHIIKRKAFKATQAGEDADAVILAVGRERVRCPLLNGEERCALYAFRPISCRVYGIPAAIGGKGRTCGASAFTPGKHYPTVNLDAVTRRLLELSLEMTRLAQSPYTEMHTMLVPLSMALMTEYNATYFGGGRG